MFVNIPDVRGDNLSSFHKGQILTEGMILVREDICDWISTLFAEVVITGDTFLPFLHTGVLLCDLVQKIYQHVSLDRLPSSWPKKPPRADRRATPCSFKARDNTSLFLSWCRSVGLRNTILFETKGLMNSDEEKNIVLTLLHLGEMCIDFDIAVPQFAKFKKEIDSVQRNSGRYSSVGVLTDNSDIYSTDSGFHSARSTINIDTIGRGSIPSKIPVRSFSVKHSQDKVIQSMSCFDRQTQRTLPRNNIRVLKTTSSNIRPPRQIRSKSINDISHVLNNNMMDSTDSTSSKVHKKVCEISKRCCCETKFTIERVTMQEGMYRIGSKNIFIRMFKENIMLRIGGGWETLGEYLDKVDPCCKENSRRKSTSNLCEKNMSSDIMGSGDLANFRQTEFTKIKRIGPNKCLT